MEKGYLIMGLDSEVRKLLADHLTIVHADPQGRIAAGPGPEVSTYALLGPVPLPVTLHGRTYHFHWYVYAPCEAGEIVDPASSEALLRRLSSSDGQPSSVLVMGDLLQAEAPLVRVHSCCATGDIFGSQRCECGPQLRRAMQMVADEGAGAIVYLAAHEGRGIGLFAKAAAYLLQDKGLDTYEANRRLGFPDDGRNFAEAAFIIHQLRGAGRPIRLISNNPEKRRALEAGGVTVADLVPLIMGLSQHNVRYIRTKRAYGHLFSEDDVDLEQENGHGFAVAGSTAFGL